ARCREEQLDGCRAAMFGDGCTNTFCQLPGATLALLVVAAVRRLVEHQTRDASAGRGGAKREARARRVPVHRRGASAGGNQRVDAVDLTCDVVRRGIAAVASPAAVEAEHGKALR